MGDRVVFQVISSDRIEFSPMIYGHWCGCNVPDICIRIRERMMDRIGDVTYTAARLLQEMINNDNDDCGYGIRNTDHILGADDSHGDAGVILVEASLNGLKFHVIPNSGYYLGVDKNGIPTDYESKLVNRNWPKVNKVNLDELKNALNAGIVEVAFKKVDDDVRIMRCTRNGNLIPENEIPRGNLMSINDPEDVTRVYEMNEGWKSFKDSNVIDYRVICELVSKR